MEIDKSPQKEQINFELPMSNVYLYTKFYVRKCYEEYYGYIKELLEKPTVNYITLTGTPGITHNSP